MCCGFGKADALSFCWSRHIARRAIAPNATPQQRDERLALQSQSLLARADEANVNMAMSDHGRAAITCAQVALMHAGFVAPYGGRVSDVPDQVVTMAPPPQRLDAGIALAIGLASRRVAWEPVRAQPNTIAEFPTPCRVVSCAKWRSSQQMQTNTYNQIESNQHQHLLQP